MIPETAYDTIRTSIIFYFNRRVIIPWSVRRIGALSNNAVLAMFKERAGSRIKRST